MKNKGIFAVCAFVLLGSLPSCGEGGGTTITNQYVDYREGENKFTVVAIQREGMSEKDAKEVAIKRAAELTRKSGFRYFSVNKEFTSTIIHTDPTDEIKRFPGNLYQEEIQQQEFNRDTYFDRKGPGSQTFPCYQVEVECYERNPGKGAYDACDYVECYKKG